MGGVVGRGPFPPTPEWQALGYFVDGFSPPLKCHRGFGNGRIDSGTAEQKTCRRREGAECVTKFALAKLALI
jgi:hypothetical protein